MNVYEFRPTTAEFKIFLENNAFCISLKLTKGNWGWPDEGYMKTHICMPFMDDCDIHSEDPNHCHKIGQPPMIFSVERKNLDILFKFCEEHKHHISNTFKTFLEKNFPIK
jgi:hypothetical protein